MDELEQLLQKFIHRSETSARFPHGIVHPNRDWLFALAGVTVLVIMLVALSSVAFVHITAKSKTFSGGGVAGTSTISRESLREAVDAYQAKRHLLEDLRATEPALGQP